ncbi:hypothetical protein [Pararhodobacter aggregans]|uniref:Tripartite tricarboxylate transporter TctB family protein n=1 Tax=Pararhodobacter aggregans TaxID=404875 RepID=A0A2T7UM71_9RHOB|nr:hypothetical protein [Pararhodobacter aggregans]PTX00012.1 hypothetical protein C8N33_11297 [Pararhodobacter aggregans]PVE45766.1 hypothetical protein DDE23_19880 [Pararhodobacter aggregans]
MPRLTADLVLGLAALALALAALLFWVPADTGSGIVERIRGQYRIGDAMGPAVAFGILILAGIVLAIEAWLKPASGPGPSGLGSAQLGFLLLLFVIFMISLLAMRWTGPALASLLTEGGYRSLRASLPWKYLGYVTGGTILVGSLIALAERRISVRAFVIGFFAALLLAMFYDLPFRDFLLPPNGDL